MRDLISMQEQSRRGHSWNGIVIVYMIVGVPVLAAVFLSTGARMPDRLVLFGNGMLTAVALATYVLRDRIPISHILFILFFLVLVFATLWSEAAGEGGAGNNFKSLIGCFLWSSVFLFGRLFFARDRDLRRAFRILWIVGYGISASVYGSVLSHIVGGSFGEVLIFGGAGLRAFGPIGDQVGFIIALFVVMALVRRRWLAFGVHLAAMALTGTRGAVVVLGVSLLALWIFDWKESGSLLGKWRLTHGLLFICIVAAVLMSPSGAYLLVRTFNSELLLSTGSARLGSMALGMSVFLDNPLKGVGYAGFRDVVWGYAPERYFDIVLQNYIATTSNQYLQTATDGGIIALTVLISLLALMIYNAQTASRIFRGVVSPSLMAARAWMVGIVLGNQTAVWLLPGSLVAYLLFLVAAMHEAILSRVALRGDYACNSAPQPGSGESRGERASGRGWRTHP